MNSLLRSFPLRVAVGALLVYLATLCHGVTTDSLGITAKVAGWDWQPMVGVPLYWLLTLPLRVLPAGWLPLPLNFLSALCAAATLGILVRSLELLPWSRPLASLKGGWRYFPGLVAVVVCGCEFNFWQEATSASIESVDVLVFVIPIWCLLEYRRTNQWPWLRASVFIWGMGMAQNWMMVLALPLFVVGIFWLRPSYFLKKACLLTLAGWGLAGFACYLLLPLWNGLQHGSSVGMGKACLISLQQTKYMPSLVYHQFWAYQRLMGLAVALFYLVPVLACLLRLPDEQTANKSPVDRLQIWLFHGLRAALLLICLWLAFDPAVGPRGIVRHQLKFSLPLLSFDYLCGLGAGYLAGSLLLAGMAGSSPARFRDFAGQWVRGLERAVLPLVVGLALVTGVGLVVRNLAPILDHNRLALSAFGELAVRSLPSGGGILLGDFADELTVFQAVQARHPDAQRWVPVDTQLLPNRHYRERLAKLHPGDWLLSANYRDNLSAEQMLRLVASLVRSNQVYYLHPSFGPFFEFLYLEPSGLLFEVKSFATNSVWPPALTANALAQNEQFWESCTPLFGSLQTDVRGRDSSGQRWLERKLHLEPGISRRPSELGEWLSLALNGWGVALQRQENLPAARHRFEQALSLNPQNWIAGANLFCNTNLQARKPLSIAQVSTLANQFRNPQQLALSTARLGPGDEPTICFLVGGAFEQAGLMHQALQQYERAVALSPQSLAPRFALASLEVRCRLTAPAAQNIDFLHAELQKRPEATKLGPPVSLLQAELCLLQTNPPGAVAIGQSLLRQNPGNTEMETAVLQLYVASNDFTDADAVVTSLLAERPDDLSLLLAKSGTLLRTGRATEAIPVLNRILSQTNSLPLRINLAIAQEQVGNYEAARAVYLGLQADAAANQVVVNMGLAEVSWQLHDTNQAVHYYAWCLSNTAPESAQWKIARTRMEDLGMTALKH